jgi:hypothetical protein
LRKLLTSAVAAVCAAGVLAIGGPAAHAATTLGAASDSVCASTRVVQLSSFAFTRRR